MGRTTYTVSSAGFIVDPQSVDRLNGRQIDWTKVGEDSRETPGQKVVVGAAGAAANATSVPVVALTAALASGVALDFGGAKFARTTAAAAAGATSITVAAIPTALVSGDTATVAGSGSKRLKAGTAVGDAASSGKLAPRVVTSNPAIGLLETDAVQDSQSAATSGFGVIVGGVVYENLLPDAVSGVLPSAIKTELNTAGASKGFLFQTYGDDRT